MSTDIAIDIQNLSKCYHIYNRPRDRLLQALYGRRKQFYREFWALRDISFSIKKGEAVGIIGRNGSGKSTLLQLISQTLTPTTGSISVNGKVAALLELGAGFNPEFTGRENVYMNGAILGFNKAEIDERFAEIAAFADIGDFIEQPVKTYSSGMFVRLAFAVQACIQPDILIVDEALSVGDIFFQQKCHQRMAQLLEKKTAVIIVSHDMAMIEKYSDKVILLDKGICRFIGQPNEGVERYYQLMKNDIPAMVQPIQASRRLKEDTAISNESVAIWVDPVNEILMHKQIEKNACYWPDTHELIKHENIVQVGDDTAVKFIGVTVCNTNHELCTTFEVGDTAYFYYEYETLKSIDVPIGGIVLTDRMNVNVHGKMSLQYLLPAPAEVKAGKRIRFCQVMTLTVAPGEYVFQVSLSHLVKEHYLRIKKMSNIESDSLIKVLLRIRQAGKLLITEKKDNFSLPFYGYADLQGSCNIAIL